MISQAINTVAKPISGSACGLLLALLVGCGGPPSALDGCKKSCDKQGECTTSTALAIFQCKTACDTMKAQYEDQDTQIEHNCSNASSIRSEIYNCFADFCDTSLAANCANDAYQQHCSPK